MKMRKPKDDDVQQALYVLQDKGLSPDEVKQGMERLTPVRKEESNAD